MRLRHLSDLPGRQAAQPVPNTGAAAERASASAGSPSSSHTCRFTCFFQNVYYSVPVGSLLFASRKGLVQGFVVKGLRVEGSVRLKGRGLEAP